MRRYDKDGDGVIKGAEVTPTTKRFDTNNDGKVTEAEIKKYFTSRFNRAAGGPAPAARPALPPRPAPSPQRKAPASGKPAAKAGGFPIP